MLVIFAAESSKRRSIFGRSLAAVSERFSLMAMVLETPQMESAIDIEHFAGAERQQLPRDHRDGLAHVVRLAPTPDGCEAIGDELFVLLPHRPGHVRGDDPGANFIDIDPVLGEP